jgi:carboxyl-terminal processing protease
VINPSIKERLVALAGKSKSVATGSQNKFGQLNLTIAKFYRINGGATQHKGVLPDVEFPSVIPLDKYGEDTEPSAMPYDVIAKTDFTKAGDFTPVLPELKKLHDQRMRTSDSYKYLLADIADMKKRENEKTITLNEAELKRKRDADEKIALEKNNARRTALGLPALKKGQIRPKNEDLDFLKREAGQILTDYITLDNKISSVIKK